MTAGYDEQIKTNFQVTLGHSCQAFIQETLNKHLTLSRCLNPIEHSGI